MRRGAVTLRGLRREVRERRAIWREHEANARLGNPTTGYNSHAEWCAARADELEWVDGLIRDYAKRVATPASQEAGRELGT